ncbi:MAG: hypothetical protein ACOCV2_01645 [Persicimonas sp.]
MRGLWVLAAIAALALAGCGDDFFDVGAQILDVQVDPNELSETEAPNASPEVTIEVTGFEGQIVDADAFLEESDIPDGEDRYAQKGDIDVVGNTIILEDVRSGWFQGLEPGNYNVGAEVVSDEGENIQQLDLETVTITE